MSAHGHRSDLDRSRAEAPVRDTTTAVLAGRWTAAQAAAKLELSLRQMRRLLAPYRRNGSVVLVHGNRNRTSPRRMAPEVREEMLPLARISYNDHHLTDVRTEDHNIRLSRSSVRRLRREAALASPRKKRQPRHRSSCPGRPQPGMLLPVDGSQHGWLEGRTPKLHLIAAVDDASAQSTSRISSRRPTPPWLPDPRRICLHRTGERRRRGILPRRSCPAQSHPPESLPDHDPSAGHGHRHGRCPASRLVPLHAGRPTRTVAHAWAYGGVCRDRRLWIAAAPRIGELLLP